VLSLTSSSYSANVWEFTAASDHAQCQNTHSVRLLWARDRPVAQTLTRDRNLCPQRDSNPQSQQASGRKATA